MIQTEDICSVRKKLGLSQEQMAEKLGVSRNTVSRWERGEFNPSADKLAALARLVAQAEGSAAPEEGLVPKEATVKQPVVPVKSKHWAMMLVCIGVICTLLIGIISLMGIYSINQKLEPVDTAKPMEEMTRKEVDASSWNKFYAEDLETENAEMKGG